MTLLRDIAQSVLSSAVDVLPVAVFLFAFQRLVIGDRIQNLKQIVVGFAFVVVGLGLFLAWDCFWLVWRRRCSRSAE